MAEASAREPEAGERRPEAARSRRIVVISPVRDEAETLSRTIESLAAQTLLPVRWVVVDDGSSDATPAILEAARARLPWLRVVRREDRGARAVGPGVVEAFYAGLESVDVPHDYLAKMDGDLEFGPRYLEQLVEQFEADARLGSASGKVFRRENGELIEEFMVDEMVAGPFKLYRRDVFDRIGGLVRAVMWDGIDFHQIRMAGFRTRSLHDPELRLIHLRLMGSSDRNVYRGRLRWGRGQWFLGSSLAYVVASGIFRMHEKPRVVGGLLIIAGYLGAALRRAPRFGSPGFRADVRSWQRARLLGVLRGEGPR